MNLVKKLVAGVMAVACMLAVQGSAKAASVDTAKLKGTKWLRIEKNSDGSSKLTGMLFLQDGKFIYRLRNNPSTPISEVAGRYELTYNGFTVYAAGRVLTFKVDVLSDSIMILATPEGPKVYIRYRD